MRGMPSSLYGYKAFVGDSRFTLWGTCETRQTAASE